MDLAGTLQTLGRMKLNDISRWVTVFPASCATTASNCIKVHVCWPDSRNSGDVHGEDIRCLLLLSTDRAKTAPLSNHALFYPDMDLVLSYCYTISMPTSAPICAHSLAMFHPWCHILPHHYPQHSHRCRPRFLDPADLVECSNATRPTAACADFVWRKDIVSFPRRLLSHV
jgi:hypothetical protein